MTLNYRNTQLYYTSKGIGNPIVFLHGFLESSNMWESFIPSLSEKRQVICIDLPGHGQSGNLEKVHSMELMAEAVHYILSYLKVSRSTLVGHSMGGYVSLAYAEKYPSEISGLVLMNSTPDEDSEERKETRDRAASLVERNKAAFINMAISNLISEENSLKFKNELDELKKEALKFSSTGIIAAIKGMKIRTNRLEILTNLKIPKYLIAGENDPILDYRSIKEIANHCNSELLSLNDGHLSYLENRDEIKSFLHLID
ncbi:alpha/beta fold hydrolase [Gillisia sp. Hel_I_29]|uniref:alpha/beta fold hydrolase n=1 Tax=Gillisia sp. Hel_I_29 TaxID=1249975 RepID=UPI0005540626|nr:alpha/beta hydrolase [Gillisia sp. Hel_I_29]